MILTLLNKNDAPDLYTFELNNREYFEQSVPGRGDHYFEYENFDRVLDELLAEQNQRRSFFFLIKNMDGTIAGRINIVDIEDGIGHVGYRVAESFTGQGVASLALQQLIERVSGQFGLKQLQAKTTTDNLSSQRVMEKNGFKLVDVIEEYGITFKHYAIQL